MGRSAGPQALSRDDLNRALLARQMLLARDRMGVVDAIGRLVGLQAQVARPPFIGLWSRLEEFRRDDLAALLRDRTVVRSTAMRVTLHLLTAEDYVRMRGALQPALARGMRSALSAVIDRMDLQTLEREARDFFRPAPATFDALRKHLAAGADGLERAMAYAVRTHVPLVQVPTSDPWCFPASADFALADDWLGRPVATSVAPAHELVRRYLAAFGPATPADAHVWSGLAGLKPIFEDLRPELVTFRDPRGRELFDLPEAPRPGADAPAPVRFVPEYDNLVLSHADRTRIIDEEDRPRIVSRNLQVRATFLIGGYVAGTWKVERKTRSATLVIEPFGRLLKRVKGELEEEGEALLAFVEPEAAKRAVRFAAR